MWGKDIFNEYGRGKQFIPYTDHKPLEKLSHLHNQTLKILNTLQSALLEHDFIIQYQKGLDMPAEYLSRLPGTREKIVAFDPFQAGLTDLQKHNPSLKLLNKAIKSKI
jgi:hypothetical protein